MARSKERVALEKIELQVRSLLMEWEETHSMEVSGIEIDRIQALGASSEIARVRIRAELP